MADQLLQNEKIKEISCHFQQRLKDNIQHLQKIFHMSSDECQQLKEQVLAMKFYIDQRCSDFSQLVLDVNHKGESRELLKKLSDLMTLSELLNEDITYYNEKISEQETQIYELSSELKENKLELSRLLIENKEMHGKLKQEAQKEIRELEEQINNIQMQLSQQEDSFLKQIFMLETQIKQQKNTISDLEIGRGSLVKTIQQKEELIKRQSNHYDTKMSDQKLYWQTKLIERTAELEQQNKDQQQQWEIKCKCIQNDFEIYKKNTMEQLEQLNLLLNLKDKDFEKLKESYDKLAEEFKLKEFFIQTHKDDSEKRIDDLLKQLEQLKELQINLEQKVNHQYYEYNKLIQQHKESDIKFKKESQKISDLQIELDAQIKENGSLKQNLQQYQGFITEIYSNTTSFLNLEVKTQNFCKMLQFSSEYVLVLIRQIQEQKLEYTELQNIFESSNLDLKNKLAKSCQTNLTQEKIISNLEKKVSELQKNLLQNSLIRSQDSEKHKKRLTSQSINKLEDLQVFACNMKQSEVKNQLTEEQNIQIEHVNPSLKSSQVIKTQTNEEPLETQKANIEAQVEETQQEEIIEKTPSQQQLEIESQSESKVSEINLEQIESPPSPLIQSKEKQASSIGNSSQLPLLMGMKEKETQEIDEDDQQEIIEAENISQDLQQQLKGEESQKSIKKSESQMQSQEIINPMQTSDVQIKTALSSPRKRQSEKQNQFINIQAIIEENEQIKQPIDQDNQTQELQNETLESNQKQTIDETLLIQKSSINSFHYQKLKKLKGSERKQTQNKSIRLKLETEVSNFTSTKKTPETAAETFVVKTSRTAQIQTDWLLGTTPFTSLQKTEDFENFSKDGVEKTQKLYNQLLEQYQELEQEILKLHLIIEYLQKNQPEVKITQEVATYVNLDSDIFDKVFQSEKQVNSQKKQIFLLEVQIDEKNDEIKEKEKEVEELHDLISSQSDQVLSLKLKNQNLENQLQDLKEKLEAELQLKSLQNQVQVSVFQKDDKVKLKQQSNTIVIKKETKKDIQRPSTPQKPDQTEELRLKIFQQEKIIRSLNLQIAKKDEQLQQKANRQENQAQLAQIQNFNVEVIELKKQLEQKTEQVGKCYTLIKYLENELENYKDNYNVFTKPKQQNTERIIRSVQANFPQASMPIQKKLPLLQFDEQQNTTMSKNSYKKRYIFEHKLEITLYILIRLRIMIFQKMLQKL